ncbi:hypothetical protein P0136_10435 [Lentisphaerota bacterium ZTH]|nr:hypothetical protein JYG24_12055 [Lentisphaerota bacterium]WET05778.1 hypothetical protein P0136_10435 [Lentisphaerota bacterium ZTH]
MTNLTKICITIIIIGGVFILGFLHRSLVENNVYRGGQSFVLHPALPESMTDGSSEVIIGGLDIPVVRSMQAGTLEQVKRSIYYKALGNGWRIYNRKTGAASVMDLSKSRDSLDFITPCGIIVGYKLQQTGQGLVMVTKMQLEKAQINRPYLADNTSRKIPAVLRDIMVGNPVIFFRRSSGSSASMLLTTSSRQPVEVCESNLRQLLLKRGWQLQTPQNAAVKQHNMYRYGHFIIAEKNNTWCNIAVSSRGENTFIAYRLSPTSVRKTFSADENYNTADEQHK